MARNSISWNIRHFFSNFLFLRQESSIFRNIRKTFFRKYKVLFPKLHFFFHLLSLEIFFLKYKKNMRLKITISRNITFLILELESSISWNIIIFLILVLERDENNWFTSIWKYWYPCVTTTSMIRQNMYDIKLLWFIGLIFELRTGLGFQYTQLQLRSWCTKYICVLNTIFTAHLQKKFTFQKKSLICA